MRKNRGITIIALIITIILMLILLSISINLAIKGNLFGSAEKAVAGTNDKVAQEQQEVDYLMGELINIEQSNCTHEWEEIIIKNPSCTERGEKKMVCTKCKKEETVSVPKLPHDFKDGKCTICEEDLILGTYIRGYDPSIGENGETITTSYTSTGSQTGGTLETEGTLDGTKGNGYGDQTFTVTSIPKWRVVKQQEDGKIIITTADTIKTDENEGYVLMGQAGYNNNSKELNKICSIYGQGKYADKSMYTVGDGTTKGSGARSIAAIDARIVENTDVVRITYKRDSEGYIWAGDTKSSYQDKVFQYYDETSKKWKQLEIGESVELTDKSYNMNLAKWTDLEREMFSKNSDNENINYFTTDTVRFHWNGMGRIRYGPGVLYWTGPNSFHLLSTVTTFYSSGQKAKQEYDIRPVVYLKQTVKLIYDEIANEYIITE